MGQVMFLILLLICEEVLRKSLSAQCKTIKLLWRCTISASSGGIILFHDVYSCI